MKTFRDLIELFVKESTGTPSHYVNMRNGYKLHIYSGACEANIYYYEDGYETPALKFMISESSKEVKVVKCYEGIVEYSDYKTYSFDEHLTQLDGFVEEISIIEAIISL